MYYGLHLPTLVAAGAEIFGLYCHQRQRRINMRQMHRGWWVALAGVSLFMSLAALIGWRSGLLTHPIWPYVVLGCFAASMEAMLHLKG